MFPSPIPQKCFPFPYVLQTCSPVPMFPSEHMDWGISLGGGGGGDREWKHLCPSHTITFWPLRCTYVVESHVSKKFMLISAGCHVVSRCTTLSVRYSCTGWSNNLVTVTYKLLLQPPQTGNFMNDTITITSNPIC